MVDDRVAVVGGGEDGPYRGEMVGIKLEGEQVRQLSNLFKNRFSS